MDYNCSKRIERWGNALCVIGVLLLVFGCGLLIFAIMGGVDYMIGAIALVAGLIFLPGGRLLNGISLLVYDAELRLNDRAKKEKESE